MVYLSVSVSIGSWRQIIFSLKYVVKMRVTEPAKHFTIAAVAFHIHWFRRKYIYFRVHWDRDYTTLSPSILMNPADLPEVVLFSTKPHFLAPVFPVLAFYQGEIQALVPLSHCLLFWSEALSFKLGCHRIRCLPSFPVSWWHNLVQISKSTEKSGISIDAWRVDFWDAAFFKVALFVYVARRELSSAWKSKAKNPT